MNVMAMPNGDFILLHEQAVRIASRERGE